MDLQISATYTNAQTAKNKTNPMTVNGFPGNNHAERQWTYAILEVLPAGFVSPIFLRSLVGPDASSFSPRVPGSHAVVGVRAMCGPQDID